MATVGQESNDSEEQRTRRLSERRQLAYIEDASSDKERQEAGRERRAELERRSREIARRKEAAERRKREEEERINKEAAEAARRKAEDNRGAFVNWLQRKERQREQAAEAQRQRQAEYALQSDLRLQQILHVAS